MERLRQFKQVYLGTPYSRYEMGLNMAFAHASRLAGQMLKKGVQVYSPIAHTHPIAMFGEIDPLDHEIWLPFDRTMWELSSAMVVGMLPGWKESYGVAKEIEYFNSVNKPLYSIDPETLVVEEW